MITVGSAPTLSREIVKRSGYHRATIADLSKAEERGDPEARAGRELTTTDFDRRLTDAETAVDQTRQIAGMFEAAAVVVRSGSRSPGNNPISRAAARCSRLGLSKPRRQALGLKLASAAARARASAEKADDRLADHHDDLESARLLGSMLQALADSGFKKSDPAVAEIRTKYQRSQNAARSARTRKAK
nr:hypothetical protein [uncultured Ruegeria sp.]